MLSKPRSHFSQTCSITAIAVLGILCSSFSARAATVSKKITCAGTAHTTQHIRVNHAASCVLTKLYEQDTFCLVDASGKTLEGTTFDVHPGEAPSFGLVIAGNADFNMEYAVTCVAKDGNFAKSPKVIFTVGADSPADPNISQVALYGAQGSWSSTNVGEDFSFQF